MHHFCDIFLFRHCSSRKKWNWGYLTHTWSYAFWCVKSEYAVRIHFWCWEVWDYVLQRYVDLGPRSWPKRVNHKEIHTWYTAKHMHPRLVPWKGIFQYNNVLQLESGRDSTWEWTVNPAKMIPEENIGKPYSVLSTREYQGTARSTWHMGNLQNTHKAW